VPSNPAPGAMPDLEEAHVMIMTFAPENRKRRRQIEKVLDSARALPA